MVKEVVAKRYAKALFQVFSSNQLEENLERTLLVLQAVAQAFKEHDTFKNVMLHPGIDHEIKIRALKVILEKMQAGGPVVRFLEYLVKKNRFRYLAQITQAFCLLVSEFQGMITVPINTAKELSEQEQETVRRGIESVTGRKVQVQWSLNPSLIGGMVVHVGEAVVDGSIFGQLQAIRRKMMEA
jgi:F-type H+-transporting ATPase subunit delta